MSFLRLLVRFQSTRFQKVLSTKVCKHFPPPGHASNISSSYSLINVIVNTTGKLDQQIFVQVRRFMYLRHRPA